jgi:hypothetical protein
MVRALVKCWVKLLHLEKQDNTYFGVKIWAKTKHKKSRLSITGTV